MVSTTLILLWWNEWNKYYIVTKNLHVATNITMGKPKELSIDLEELIIDLNRKSLSATSKQLQFPRFQDQLC